jgi:hypothetical protein
MHNDLYETDRYAEKYELRQEEIVRLAGKQTVRQTGGQVGKLVGK